jgi:hypothetical protein
MEYVLQVLTQEVSRSDYCAPCQARATPAVSKTSYQIGAAAKEECGTFLCNVAQYRAMDTQHNLPRHLSPVVKDF